MKWSRFWQRQRRDADLRQELEAYVEQETAERIADGMSPEEARAAAARKLGNVTRIREDVYDRNSLVLLETLWKDLIYAVRVLRRNPGFSLVAVLSVALGIGSNASVFTLLDQVMLRPLPVERPNELVTVTAGGFQYGGSWGDGDELSYSRYEDLRDNNQVFAGMFCRVLHEIDASIRGAGERVLTEVVSGTYFSVLGVVPAAGRVLDPTDDRSPSGHPVVVLSHRFWRERFQSDPAAVGESIRMNNLPMTIVGVAREGFEGTNLGASTDVFVPLSMTAEMTPITRGLQDRRTRWLNVFARLKPGVSATQAEAAIQPFYVSRLQFEAEQDTFSRASARDKARFLEGNVRVTPAPYGKSRLRRQLAGPLWTLTVVGALVLIIACANVANLLLARASVRRREMAVRLAIGATRRRVVRQLLVESLLLALIGGAVGLLLATWGAEALLAFFSQPDAMLTVTPLPDARVLAVNLVICLVVGVLFGLAPAWQSTQPDVAGTLKSESIGVLGGGYARLRKGLVVTQVALSLLLLVGSGVFLRSLQNLLALDAGFDTARLLSFAVAPGSNGYPPAQTTIFAKTLLERVRATAGVSGAGFVSNPLLEGGTWNSFLTIEGRPYDPNDPVLTYNNRISPGYFDAMGIRLVAGRDFDARDERQPGPGSQAAPARVAIVNEEFVRRFLNGRDPIGVHIGGGRDPGMPTPIRIVGVVTTAKYNSLRADPQPQVYFPYLESPPISQLWMYVRTGQPPASMVASMREIVRQIDPALPIRDLRTFEEQVRVSLVNERFVASLSAVLGVLATLLAAIGLYGVMAYTVARRTRDIAVRVAFGAMASRITVLILREMLALVVIGMLLAVPALWWLQRFVSSQLYGVSPTDPISIVSAAGTLLLAAAVAVLVPCRRALRIEPMLALREE
jgi:putative ABC transport system permease protein